MGCSNSKVTNDANSKKHQLENSSRISGKNSLLIDVNADPNASIKTLTFRHVMQDPLGRTYFMMFLKKEHAEENLIFFEVSYKKCLFLLFLISYCQTVETVKKVETNDLTKAAQDLVASYLIPGVETEVNISDQMKRKIISLAEGDVGSKQEEFIKQLERAQNEVMMILAMGAFPRFLKSNFFVQYKLKAKQQREGVDGDNDLRRAERV